MGELATALRYHQSELEIAEELELLNLQARACGNLGMVHESLGNFDEAVRYQEQHLSVASQTNDKQGKTLAFSSLGKQYLFLVKSDFLPSCISSSPLLMYTVAHREHYSRFD